MNHQEAAQNRVIVLWVAGQIAERTGLYGANKLSTEESRRLLGAMRTEEQQPIANYMFASASVGRGVALDPELLKNAATLAGELEGKWRRTADIVQFRTNSFMYRKVTDGTAHVDNMLAVAKKHKLEHAVSALEALKTMMEIPGISSHDARSVVAIHQERTGMYGIDARQFRLRTRSEEEILEDLDQYQREGMAQEF